MIANKHIINKVFLEVNTKSTKTAYALKDRLDVFLKEQVFPIIETYFEAKAALFPEAAVRFDKIELQVNHTDLDDFRGLRDQIIRNLRKKMDHTFDHTVKAVDQGEMVLVDNDSMRIDAFFFFLTTGKKPWWKADLASIVNLKAIETMISENGFRQRLLEHLAKKMVQERLINQFDDATLAVLLSNREMPKKKALSILKKNRFRDKFWKAVIHYTLFQEAPVLKTKLRLMKNEAKATQSEYMELETFAAALVGESLEAVEILEKESLEQDEYGQEPEPSQSRPVEEGIFLDNAGLVLLHPFLKNFFINTKLADSEGILRPKKVQTAIHLLHYIGTKKEQQLESELVLEKFLCGHPLGKSIKRDVKLSKGLKELGEALLQQTIAHWGALKNTSPDGLRTGFLQREGKLIIEADKYRLIVERKTQDILLDKIPWNVHLFKLPWVNKLVFVEW